MPHFVFAITSGGYVGTRKNNGRMYESRPTAAADLSSARVFNTRSAASNAGGALGVYGNAVEVSLVLAGVR